MKKITKPTRISEVKRNWHLINAKDEILGRIATKIAELLMGKSKAYFTRSMDVGDFVVVLNAKDVKTTGKKEELKTYKRYSGYSSGLKVEALKDLRIRKPEEIIIHAVSGMLPHNRLHDKMLKRLFVFKEEQHPYGDKFENSKSEAENTK